MNKVISVENDGSIEIATALSANAKNWVTSPMMWSEFLSRLSSTVVTNETYKEFMNSPKDVQKRIKDVGGYVGGRLLNGRRTKESVQYRTLLTLDIDFSTPDFWWNFTFTYKCAACIHGTHKSTPASPRHRLIIPFSREVTTEEYEPIARRVASTLNIDLFDQSTYETNRLMYWPSTPSDVEYYFDYQDGPFLDPDQVLATYKDWRDVVEWPVSSTFNDRVVSAVAKQEDPCGKRGLIGAWCRTYTMTDVIDKFLQDVYVSAGEGRYTYAAGTTSGGLVVYDDKFAYSHHGTDPAGGKLSNAYDLVRIHKFGHLDGANVKEGVTRPSDKAMERFILADKDCMRTLGEEKLTAAQYDFGEATLDGAPGDEPEQSTEVSTEWMADLKANTKGEYESCADNINLILRNDPILSGAFALNSFDNRRYLMRSMPWRSISGVEPVRDVDYSGVRNYIECMYRITSSTKIDDALSVDIERRSFHPVRDYLNGLTWDGAKRVDTLLVDYFGADDTPYTRATIRKALCAAVARVFSPGTKYDMVPILVGPQGTYKSTFLRKLGRGWFSDTFTTMSGKEAYEQLQGSWIIEIAELSAFKKSESESIKQFISKCDDTFRPAYGRTVEVYKRQCVFFGTTNDSDFLKDPTGNRRYNPIDVHPGRATKSVMDMTDDVVGQIWAEAVELYRNGENLYFDADEAKGATEAQEAHSATDERLGVIEEYLNKDLPECWDALDIYDRRTWLDGQLKEIGVKPREYVTVAEIWCECLRKGKDEMNRYNTREINDIMRQLKCWVPGKGTRLFPGYGKQRYYVRTINNTADDLF